MDPKDSVQVTLWNLFKNGERPGIKGLNTSLLDLVPGRLVSITHTTQVKVSTELFRGTGRRDCGRGLLTFRVRLRTSLDDPDTGPFLHRDHPKDLRPTHPTTNERG